MCSCGHGKAPAGSSAVPTRRLQGSGWGWVECQDQDQGQDQDQWCAYLWKLDSAKLQLKRLSSLTVLRGSSPSMEAQEPGRTTTVIVVMMVGFPETGYTQPTLTSLTEAPQKGGVLVTPVSLNLRQGDGDDRLGGINT